MKGNWASTKKQFLGIALMAVVAFSAYAREYCPGSDFEVISIDGGVSIQIVEYVGSNKEIRIPPRINNRPVTSIGEGAFRDKNLTDVIIPGNVRTIGNNAFANNRLTSIIFCERISISIVSIGEGAFKNNQITNVIIPNSVIHIGRFAFTDNQLTSITISNRVNRIGEGAFKNNRLTVVNVPRRVTHVGAVGMDVYISNPRGHTDTRVFLNAFDPEVSIAHERGWTHEGVSSTAFGRAIQAFNQGLAGFFSGGFQGRSESLANLEKHWQRTSVFNALRVGHRTGMLFGEPVILSQEFFGSARNARRAFGSTEALTDRELDRFLCFVQTRTAWDDVQGRNTDHYIIFIPFFMGGGVELLVVYGRVESGRDI